MPKMGGYKYLFDTVFYLYPDVDSAKTGLEAGGTGFLVAIPSSTKPEEIHHVYAVTNRHVACGSESSPPCSTIRINRLDGSVDVFETDPAEWVFLPEYDIAAINLSLDPNIHKVEAIIIDMFLDKKYCDEQEIDAGDDVFMIGRFIDNDGKETNRASIRFGHISIMNAKAKILYDSVSPAHIVELNSRVGYSGSPVFVYRTHGSIFPKKDSIMFGGHTLKLLGINWGHYKEYIKELGGDNRKEMWVPTSMALVAPASAILKVLNVYEFRAQRILIDNSLV